VRACAHATVWARYFKRISDLRGGSRSMLAASTSCQASDRNGSYAASMIGTSISAGRGRAVDLPQPRRLGLASAQGWPRQGAGGRGRHLKAESWA
jgi:hypothetical protein